MFERTLFCCSEQDRVREIYNQEGFFLNLPVIEGACKAAKEMSKMEE